ncbi:MAG TPA: helix-turn-helix transcriptional regulator [Actinomycetes bacterium]|nr:helix-turn-helix transcriptional regulator [Actinomycetes bacterium]
MTRRSPTVRRRRLGIELRQLREAADLTIDQVAKALECSDSKVSRIETGRVGATPRDVRDMLALYQVSDEQRDALIQIAREARQKGWWHEYGDVPIVPAYIGLEVAAASVRLFEPLVVPGILQTVEYARAVIHSVFPKLPPEEIEHRAELRMARQSLLTQDDPLALWVVLDEAVLHRLIGEHAVAREQLHRLIEAAELPNVTLQMLPFAAGVHAGSDGAFNIIGFDEPADPDLVFLEHAAVALYLETAEEVDRFRLLFDRLCDTALDPAASTDFIMALAKEL